MPTLSTKATSTIPRTAGLNWTDVTGDYTAAAGLRSLQFVSSGKSGAVLVAGQQGVYESQVDTLGAWYAVGVDLPNAPVYDMAYDASDNVLVVGTLGRGAWELTDVPPEVFGIPALVSATAGGSTYQAGDSPTLTVAPTEMTLDFNVNQVIDPATLAGIQIVSRRP